MKLRCLERSVAVLLLASILGTDGYLTSKTTTPAWTKPKRSTALPVSIGLGPEKKEDDQDSELVPGEDFEVPDHEKFRLSRRTKKDEQCDIWFGNLLGNDNGVLRDLAEDARKILMTPVPLENEVSLLCIYLK